MQQPPAVPPDPVQVELSKRLDSIERHLERMERHHREDFISLRQEIRQEIGEVNRRIFWVIGTQIALVSLLFAALKFT